jgi:phage FluMu protein Com
MNNLPVLNTMKCDNCGKKLAEIKITEGIVAVKCTKCGKVNIHESAAVKIVSDISY